MIRPRKVRYLSSSGLGIPGGIRDVTFSPTHDLAVLSKGANPQLTTHRRSHRPATRGEIPHTLRIGTIALITCAPRCRPEPVSVLCIFWPGGSLPSRTSLRSSHLLAGRIRPVL